jgi:hypothetical protein
MATDPAKFVVRHPAFNQTPDYPHFAADLVDFMLTAEIPNAEVLYRVIGGALEEQNKKQPFTYNKGRTLFGKIREDDPEEHNGRLSVTALGSGRFNEGFKEALLRKEGTRDVRHPFTWQFQHEDAALGIIANLSLVSNQFPEEIRIIGGAPGAPWPPHTPIIKHPVAAG